MRSRRKTKPALWTQAFPDQVKVKPERTRRRPVVSWERRMEMKAYAVEARAFVRDLQLQGKRCPVVGAFETLPPEVQRYLIIPWTGNRRSDKITECHHRHGRRGRLLLWRAGWLGVSKHGHRLIHKFQALARARGWIAPSGWWEVEAIIDMVASGQMRLTTIEYPKRKSRL